MSEKDRTIASTKSDADDLPTLHEIIDLADDFNTAMMDNDHDVARAFFALMENSNISLNTHLIALDLVRDYWGQIEGSGDRP